MFSNVPIKCLLIVTIIGFILIGCHESGNINIIEDGADIGDVAIDINYDELGLSKYDETVTLTFVREIDENFEALIGNLPGETLENNRWTQLYEQVLGISVEYDWVVQRGLYRQRLNSAIALGSIPDIVKVDVQQLMQLSNANLIQDLTESYERYATPATKEMHLAGGINTLKLATIDGKLMGIPEPNDAIERAEFIWIRMDWLEHLDLHPPQTMDELLHIVKAFTENDPDHNNKNDTYGFALTKYLWDPVMGLTGFMAGYNAFPKMWIEDDSGQLVYGGVQPEVKEALEVLQTMYKDGQIEEEFVFKDGMNAAKLVEEGKIGLLYGEQWSSFFPIQASRIDPNARWQAFPIVSTSSELPKVPLRFSANQFFVVSERVQHPEAIVKLFNLHLEKNWGKTANYEYYYSTPYPAWQLSPVTPFPATKNLDAYRQLSEFRINGDERILNAEARAIHNNIEDYLKAGSSDGWGWERTYGRDGAFAILEQYANNDQLLYENFLGAQAATFIENYSILKSLQDEVFLDIILGKPIDTFDSFVEDWYKLGGAIMTEAVNGLHQ